MFQSLQELSKNSKPELNETAGLRTLSAEKSKTLNIDLIEKRPKQGFALAVIQLETIAN